MKKRMRNTARIISAADPASIRIRGFERADDLSEPPLEVVVVNGIISTFQLTSPVRSRSDETLVW